MLCGQTFGAVLRDVVTVRYRRRLRRLVISGLDVDRRLPVVVQIPQRRRTHVVMRGRRRHVLLVGRDTRFRFHQVARERGTEISESAQETVSDVTVHVLYYRYLVDLQDKTPNTLENRFNNPLFSIRLFAASISTIQGQQPKTLLSPIRNFFTCTRTTFLSFSFFAFFSLICV